MFLQVIAFLNSSLAESPDRPDVELHVSSFVDGRKDALGISALLIKPKSRGSVTINSKEPMAKPRIDPNYLSRLEDARVLREAIMYGLRMVDTPALRLYGPKFLYDEYPQCEVSQELRLFK
jgi:choline dehydrogenase-like flavoprotein